ncbi:MAG: hypothetical protein EOM05_01290 [Clostridia bacterium]|nr:hypothetical protein [Clostridia bacterium]
MLAGKDLSMLDALTISITGICMVFLELLILAVAVIIISKIVSAFSKGKENTGEKTSSDTSNVLSLVKLGTPLPETQSEGKIDLVRVSPEDAAIIMAIISNQSGIPLNRLIFKSIKLLEEKQT